MISEEARILQQKWVNVFRLLHAGFAFLVYILFLALDYFMFITPIPSALLKAVIMSVLILCTLVASYSCAAILRAGYHYTN